MGKCLTWPRKVTEAIWYWFTILWLSCLILVRFEKSKKEHTLRSGLYPDIYPRIAWPYTHTGTQHWRVKSLWIDLHGSYLVLSSVHICINWNHFFLNCHSETQDCSYTSPLWCGLPHPQYTTKGTKCFWIASKVHSYGVLLHQYISYFGSLSTI